MDDRLCGEAKGEQYDMFSRSIYESINFYTLFGIFVVGCFLGVVVEMLWCMFRYHKIESRKGLVWGPFNLVYGFGAVLMTLGLLPFLEHGPMVLFIVGCVLGGAYEYICSVVQEKVVGTVSWDYSNIPLNLHGRISLLYCFFWGILALCWGKDLYPAIMTLLTYIPDTLAIPLTRFGVLFFTVDTIHSALVICRENARLCGEPATNALWHWYDKHYPDKRVRRIYPNMQFGHTLSTPDMEGLRDKWRNRFS